MGNPKTSQHVVIVYIYIILMIKSSYKLAIPQVERQLEFVCFSLCDGPLLWNLYRCCWAEEQRCSVPRYRVLQDERGA